MPQPPFAGVTIRSPGASNLLAASSGAQFGMRDSTRVVVGIGLTVVCVMADPAGHAYPPRLRGRDRLATQNVVTQGAIASEQRR